RSMRVPSSRLAWKVTLTGRLRRCDSLLKCVAAGSLGKRTHISIIRKRRSATLIASPPARSTRMTGRINITIPQDVHVALRVYCVTHSKTIAEVVADSLRQFLAAEELRDAGK